MEKPVFTQELDEKLLNAITIKNQIAEKCMNKVKLRQNVDFSDLSPVSVTKEQTSMINKELNLMKNRTLYIMLYFLGSMAFSVKYMFKLRRLNVPMRKSIKTWAFALLSSSVLFRIYEGNLQVDFENQLEGMVLDHLFDTTDNKYENEEERLKRKTLSRNQLDFYKTSKFLK
jgi:uncharacterized membrane protein